MSRWIIEKDGTGIEKSGTGIEKAGTGIEKSGTGIEKSGTGIEKAGTGIEKAGTGIRRGLMACTWALNMVLLSKDLAVCPLLNFQTIFAQPDKKIISHNNNLKLSRRGF